MDRVFKNTPELLQQLDLPSLQKMIVMAMLTNPEDGKPSNYTLEPLPHDPTRFRIVCIDNDHAFVPAYLKEINETKTEVVAQVKTVLYCFDAMKQPLDPHVQEHFTTLLHDYYDLLHNWLITLQRRNGQYTSLFSHPECLQLQKEGCFPLIPFGKDQIARLYTKLRTLHRFLETNKTVTPLAILQHLEPQLANRYNKVLQTPLSVAERFQSADYRYYAVNEKTGTCQTLTPSAKALDAQNIPVKTLLSEDIKKNQHLTPQGAIDELKAIRESAETKDIAHLLKYLKDGQHTKVIPETIDGATLTQDQQEALLNYLVRIQDPQWRTLGLINFAALDDNRLSKLCAQLKHVETLDIRGSSITHKSLSNLCRMAINLKHLNIANTPTLARLAEEKGAFRVDFKPLDCRNLEILVAANCPKLQQIQLNAPQLKALHLSNNKIDMMRLRNVVDLVSTLPELTFLDLENNNFDKENRRTLFDLLCKYPYLSIKAEGHDVLQSLIQEAETGSEEAQIQVCHYYIPHKNRDPKDLIWLIQYANQDPSTVFKYLFSYLFKGSQEAIADKVYHCLLEKHTAIIPDIAQENDIIFRRFLAGRLIYRPNEGNDNGRIDLPIAALANPLEGTFDLSGCGDTWEYLSIATGYRKRQIPENKNKCEIWIMPRFLMERNITTTAKHYQEVYGKWHKEIPVGMFWTWGGWKDTDGDCNYLVTENFDEGSNDENLYKKYDSAHGIWGGHHVSFHTMRVSKIAPKAQATKFYFDLR